MNTYERDYRDRYYRESTRVPQQRNSNNNRRDSVRNSRRANDDQRIVINGKSDLKLCRKNRYEYNKIKAMRKQRAKAVFVVLMGVVVVSSGFYALKKIAPSVTATEKEKYVPIPTVSKNYNEDKFRINKEIPKENFEESAEIKFYVGDHHDKFYVEEFLKTEAGEYIYKYSDCYGVDPNVMAAMCMQESSLDHNSCLPAINGQPEGWRYNGFGVGLMQLESPDGSEISCYNYETGMKDVEYITMENACDIEKNIKIGCMIFRNSLDNNMGNVVLAIQSHNYGQPMIDKIFKVLYSDKSEQVKQDYNNVSWLENIRHVNQNPQQYDPNWKYDSYGDPNYISNVLKYCPSKEAEYKYDDHKITFNLETLTIKNYESIDSKTR